MEIKVLLVDDHKLMREGLRSLIEKQDNIEMIVEADTGRKAVRLVREISPDVVIMDVSMPDLNGIEATRQIISEGFSDVKIIALSGHSDKRFVSGMLAAGASGYLLKDCAFDELALAIETVIADKTYLSPEIAKIVTEEYVRYISNADVPQSSIISPREREVLQLIAEGKSTKEISSILNTSIKTIESHRRQIMKKLDINNIPALIKYALREGLTSLE